MKNNLTTSFLFSVISVITHAQQNKSGWVSQKIFQNDAFIENKGQFPDETVKEIKQPILFYSLKGNEQLFFSASSVTLCYDSLMKDENSEEREDGKKLKVLPQYMSITWEGANPNAIVEIEQPVNNYFTYSNPHTITGRPSILAHGGQRLVYKNIYSGIDVTFYYPAEGGIEYDINVHPGADISVFKMKYLGGQGRLVNRNIVISSSLGTFIDHAPIAKDEKGNSVASSFSIKNNVVSFQIADYNKANSLTIDPWVTNPNFNTTNRAYDIGYDVFGNVYAYGGAGGSSNFYQLEKFNSSGALQWMHSSYFAKGFALYGDLVTDIRDGASYIIGTPIASAVIMKVSSNGLDTLEMAGRKPKDSIEEMWRINFDYCNNKLIIGCGTPSYNYQAVSIDTTLPDSGFTKVNILHTDSIFHDIALMALDQSGNAYMATSRTAPGGSLANADSFDNMMMRLPSSLLAPTQYKVKDGYHFLELGSIEYTTGSFPTNGMNGMAATKNMVIMYDGARLTKWRPLDGKLEDSLQITNVSFSWGGLDIDCEGNIYVGDSSSIRIYDSTFTLKSVIPLPDTVYDLKATNAGFLYACGRGFVTAISIPITGCSDSACGSPIITGIDNVSNAHFANISPNPNKGIFTIDVKGVMGKGCVNIYNILGEKIYSHLSSLNSPFSIDLGKQAKGIYLYRINTEKGLLISIGKLVIQ